MKNWKTTIFGAIASVMAILDGTVNQLAAGQEVSWGKIGLGMGLALFAYFSKDFTTTGTNKR